MYTHAPDTLGGASEYSHKGLGKAARLLVRREAGDLMLPIERRGTRPCYLVRA